MTSPAAPRCPICNRAYQCEPQCRRMSRDHILPQCEGYIRDFLDCGAMNIRIMCAECNSMRGDAAHCVGIVACVLAVSASTRQRPAALLADWRRRA